MRICVGPVPGTELSADVWYPGEDLMGPDGQIGPEFIWAVLDCAGGAAALWDAVAGGERFLLGRLSVRQHGEVKAGEPHVVVGWRLAAQDRKVLSGSALFTASGQAVEVAEATLDPPPVSRRAARSTSREQMINGPAGRTRSDPGARLIRPCHICRPPGVSPDETRYPADLTGRCPMARIKGVSKSQARPGRQAGVPLRAQDGEEADRPRSAEDRHRNRAVPDLGVPAEDDDGHGPVQPGGPQGQGRG